MKTQHDGDCTIYSVMTGRPIDGICTCGFGWSERKRGNWNEMYSEERKKLQEAAVTDTVSDGLGSVWSAYCPECKRKSMEVVRPGKVQCSFCG